MAYILSKIIILIVWLINWMLIKTRLIIPALFAAIVLIFFKDWLHSNEGVAITIFSLMISGVIVSWIFTLVNTIKANRRWRKRDIAYAYWIAGEPMVAVKRVIG